MSRINIRKEEKKTSGEFIKLTLKIYELYELIKCKYFIIIIIITMSTIML